MTDAGLVVEVTERDGASVILCEGVICLASVGQLEDAIAWSMASDARLLRIDATKVKLTDSAGLRCLLETDEKCRDLGGHLEVVPSDQLARLFATVRLPGCG